MIDSNLSDNVLTLSGSFAERRHAAALEQQERAALRTESLATLRSPEVAARRRIAMWEYLHGLHLPSDTRHALINVVAKRTALSIKDIWMEQKRRSLESAAHCAQSTHNTQGTQWVPA